MSRAKLAAIDSTAECSQVRQDRPRDIQATSYRFLGLNIQYPIYEQLHRPYAVTTGKVVRQLLK